MKLWGQKKSAENEEGLPITAYIMLPANWQTTMWLQATLRKQSTHKAHNHTT